MSVNVPISEARANLPRIVERVAAGEEITLTRRGAAVAVMVRPDALRTRRADRALAVATDLLETLQQGKSTRLADLPGIDERRAEELIAYVRGSRTNR